MSSGIEFNNQQLNINKVFLLDKAQISLDSLPNQEQEKIIRAIDSLALFPDYSSMSINKLNYIPNCFIGRAGAYRIIFDFKPGKVTVIDIVNHERLEILYGSSKEAEK
ncbi:hypothetical protein H6G80_35605 [Nostoc sp. FACHB-87]|uniref:type II toxin-antitoxin system RelE family toxin n=1 Tax=Nostocaceae TaxID=1162 RepID=UPI001681E095|nr:MULTISPECIES: hypothetical protein [Nostocaceae]MBD2299456.1 hypothetical protein [Nostoc sp. FACHB-190]MBD2459342.1 hypothetical protein [Nostoc sp. FACHB-87]MBD2477242.1 hypothetical protein [Anabaena sp. FACHB-83]